MVNRTSRHLEFLIDHLHIVHDVCIFVDFGYCMDPLFIMHSRQFPLQISPRCSVINMDLVWKQK